MNCRIIIVATIAILLTGCVTSHNTTLFLPRGEFNAKGKRVGVVMTAIPTPETFYTKLCALCYPVATAANAELTAHGKTLPTDDLARLKDELVAALRHQGQDVVMLDNDFSPDDLLRTAASKPNSARRNYAPVREKYRLDKLLVVQVTNIGFTRTYSGAVATGAPKGAVKGVVYLVNLADNTYHWYQPIDIQKSAYGNWNEAPTFPGLTNAYYEAIESTRDTILQPFSGK